MTGNDQLAIHIKALTDEAVEARKNAILAKHEADVIQGQMRGVDLVEWPSRKEKDEEIRGLNADLQRVTEVNSEAVSRLNQLSGTIQYLTVRLNDSAPKSNPQDADKEPSKASPPSSPPTAN